MKRPNLAQVASLQSLVALLLVVALHLKGLVHRFEVNLASVRLPQYLASIAKPDLAVYGIPVVVDVAFQPKRIGLENILEVYQEGLSEKPTHIYRLAQAQALAGEYESAIETLEMIAPESRDEQWHVCVGSLYFAMNEIIEAETEWKQASSDSIELLRQFWNYYWLHRTPLSLQRALRYCEIAVRISQTTLEEYEARWTLGKLHFYGRSNPVEAIPHIERALSLAEAIGRDTAEVHTVLAHAYLSVQRFDEAASHARLALAQDPDSWIAHQFLGYAHLGQGDLDAAIHEFQSAADLGSDDVWCYWGLGKAYAENGLPALARQAWLKALEIDPSFEQARSALEQLDGD